MVRLINRNGVVANVDDAAAAQLEKAGWSKPKAEATTKPVPRKGAGGRSAK